MIVVPRVVLDTNIIVSAMISSTGNPAKVYRMFLNGMLTLVYSEDILTEYQDVLYRPRLHIPTEEAGKVLTAVNHYGMLSTPAPSTVSMPDESDRKFYDAAKCAEASLITGNTRHYPREPFIITPAEFIEQ